MPGFDRSGPEGQGPVTGRMRGMCQRTDHSAFADVDRGRGRGQYAASRGGSGIGRGRMRAPVAQGTETGSELTSLKKQYDSALKMIEELQKKVAAMETQQK